MRRVRPAMLIATGLLALAACGDDGSTTVAGTGPEGTGSETQIYEVTTTVLESPDHGPQLCLGGVATSLPPQCGGPDVAGFSWADVPWRESAAGTTWASVHVQGTWDGTAFTLTEAPAEPRDPPAGSVEPPDFTAPCPPPEGGWAARDPSRTGMADQEAAYDYANTQPDLAAVWVDQSAAQTILVFGFTGDVDRHRADLEARWGGMLCVTQMDHTRAELLEIQQHIDRDPDISPLGSSPDEIRGVVAVFVVLADEQTVELVRERHGARVVLTGALQPVG